MNAFFLILHPSSFILSRKMILCSRADWIAA